MIPPLVIIANTVLPFSGKTVQQLSSLTIRSRSKVLTPPFDAYTDLLLSSVPEMEIGWLEKAIAGRRMEAAGN